MKPVTQVLSAVELIDAIKDKIANKIGNENAYLLEEKFFAQFHDLGEQLEDITDAINQELQESSNEMKSNKE